MVFERLRRVSRSLRFRLLLWNAGAVALTGLAILLAVRAGVRYTLLFELDQVLREDLREIELHLREGHLAWDQLTEELNHKAQGHDFHRWFVQFYDRAGQPTWASLNTPPLPPLAEEALRQRAFSLSPADLVDPALEEDPALTGPTSDTYRVSCLALSPPVGATAAVCVGCSQRYLVRDMATIDRLVFLVGLVVFLVSPLVGHLLTSRTIQPLARMIRTTARLRPGELAQRVPIRGTGDELDSLAQTINGLLDRIADYLQKEHDFLANAAHDLRTPLAAIQSSVEVALSGARSEEEYRELLGLVIEQCSALQTLVNQLLLLAETDADRLRTDPEPVPLDQLAAQTAEMFAGVAEHFGVELVVGELPPVQVPGNRHHLRQVVSNLLDNAIKFTAARRETPAAANGAESTARPPVGKVFLDLSVDAAAGEVRLRVRDTGIGIHPEDLPRIFDRFYRADKSRTRDGVAGGTGLGLSICRAVVEAHHGSIGVRSKLGQGTTVTVHLPLAPSSATIRAGR